VPMRLCSRPRHTLSQSDGLEDAAGSARGDFAS
jgi:hypothetical protein